MISLRMRLAALIIFILSISSLAVVTTLQVIADSEIKRNQYQNIYSSHLATAEGLDMVMTKTLQLYSGMFGTNGVTAELTDDSYTILQRQTAFDGIIPNIGFDETTFAGITVITGDVNFTYHTTTQALDLPSQVLIDMVLESDDLLVQGQIIEDTDGHQLMMLGKPIHRVILGVNTTVGAAFYYVRVDRFETFMPISVGVSGYSFLMANGESIVYHPDEDYIGRVVLESSLFSTGDEDYVIREVNGQKSIIIDTDLTSLGRYNLEWKMVSILSYDELFGDIIFLNRAMSILIAMVILISAFSAFQLSSRLTQPLSKLIKDLRMFSLSDKKITSTSQYTNDEIGELEKTYDEMIDRILHLVETNTLEMESKRKLELYALQMQINPHFLYNTLDAIAWMAKIKHETEIEKLVLALAKFFRISLHKGDKFISVEEEVELIQHFLDIELIRFPDKFDMKYEIDEAVKKCETLKLILQPIVENAIKHGISQLENKGNITIKAYRSDDDIVYEIIDDGIGFNPSEKLGTPLESGLGGYGLRNVDQRIKLEYGPQYGVHVDSKPQGGTRVKITIANRTTNLSL